MAIDISDKSVDMNILGKVQQFRALNGHDPTYLIVGHYKMRELGFPERYLGLIVASVEDRDIEVCEVF